MGGVRHSEAERHQARQLRREDGLSLTEISAALGIPHSTVGDWLNGMEMERTCRLCGETFTAGYRGAPRFFCCRTHSNKWLSVFGRSVA